MRLFLRSVVNRPKRISRKRNLIWYTPSYNLSVRNKFGYMFLELTEKINVSQKKRSLRKIFYRNTLKLSCSGANNLENVIK